MPTVHRAGSLRFVVFPDDHGPPHGADGEEEE